MTPNKRLKLSGAAQGILTIVGLTTIGHAFVFALTPLLTRLYTPTEYGSFAVLAAIAAVLGTVPALRYELAIPLPSDTATARNITVGSTLLCLTFALIAVPIAFVAGPVIGAFFKNPEVGQLLPLATVGAFGYGMFRVLNQWAVRRRQYGRIGLRNLVQSLTLGTSQVGMGGAGLSSTGLIAGTAAGQLAGAAALLRGSDLRWSQFRISEFAMSARRYRRFPIWMLPAGLINAAGLFVPVIMLSVLYSAEETGAFSLAQSIVAVPLTIIGQAIAQVYLGTLGDAKRRGGSELNSLFTRTTRRLVILSFAGLLVLLTLPPLVFPPFLGAGWAGSGEMTQALALFVCAQFVANPLSQTLALLEHTRTQFAWDAARLAGTSATFLVAHALGASALAAVWSFSVASALLYLVLWLLTRRALTAVSAPDRPRGPDHRMPEVRQPRPRSRLSMMGRSNHR